MVDLFDRREQVWHEGEFDLVRRCVAATYIRHDQKGDRTVAREAYAAEIAAKRPLKMVRKKRTMRIKLLLVTTNWATPAREDA
jgi:hypothetical protein